MATYSQSLKLTLLANGEGAGTWGQTTNTNLGTLLEQAITGVQSIVMTDADYTLSNLNGLSDEARNPVLVVTGTNNAVRDIIAPLVNKQYLIINNTTGGQSIRIRGASGFTVTIPNGTKVPVFCDGTNFFSAEPSFTTGNFTVAGNLSVAGNTNAAAATFTGNVAALNISTANVAATGTGAFSGNVSALNISTANVTATGAGTFTGNVSGNAATFTGNSQFNGTGALKVPVGTSGQRPTPATGQVRFNTTDTQFEGYNGAAWSSIGGAAAGGAVYENKQSITANYTMSTDYNGESVGPITVDSGVTVTIPSGSRWVIL
jgi:hypothetical protein